MSETDPLGGPDAAGADDPLPYEISRVRISFVADRGRDAWGAREIVLAFPALAPGTAEHEAIMLLWRKNTADALAQLRADGIKFDLG